MPRTAWFAGGFWKHWPVRRSKTLVCALLWRPPELAEGDDADADGFEPPLADCPADVPEWLPRTRKRATAAPQMIDKASPAIASPLPRCRESPICRSATIAKMMPRMLPPSRPRMNAAIAHPLAGPGGGGGVPGPSGGPPG